MKGKDFKAAFILLLAAVAASVPLMTGYVLWGTDLLGSLSRIEAVSQGFGKVFPIRIAPWSSADYGHAAASFQADLFYMVPAIGRLIGMELGSVYRLTLFLINLTTAFVAFRCFGKCLKRRETVLAGSLLFVWCPYRLHEMYVSGNLGDAMAWIFLPIVLSGLFRLYTLEREGEEYGRLWMPLVCGYSLLALSSTAMLFVTLGMSLLLFLFMGKASFHKRTLSVAGKAAGAFLLINAWFLIPMVLRLRDVPSVGVTIPKDFRGLGMYPIQYLGIFLWGGDGTAFLQNGMQNAAAMCPGIAAVMPVLFYIWTLYTGGYREKNTKDCLGRRLLCVCFVLIFLSSNAFPWNLFQNRNLPFSILLSLLQSPAMWGIPACAVMIGLACLALEGPFFQEERVYKPAIFLVGGISFATAQFLLGNILKTRNYVRKEELQGLLLPMQALEQESAIWRCSEVLSFAAICAWLTMVVIRRHKGVEDS